MDELRVCDLFNENKVGWDVAMVDGLLAPLMCKEWALEQVVEFRGPSYGHRLLVVLLTMFSPVACSNILPDYYGCLAGVGVGSGLIVDFFLLEHHFRFGFCSFSPLHTDNDLESLATLKSFRVDWMDARNIVNKLQQPIVEARKHSLLWGFDDNMAKLFVICEAQSWLKQEGFEKVVIKNYYDKSF
ncbi:hypothetical protein Goklo_029484 [Gossypium klotzschianum]|uniref:Uncharacterized protein n=1 Tax=Gossypium klotzschianum TaxID=34286 RepID=A0A7J8W9D8_9ROSI|nr:hypothetical protein [Gossypium klotzschianum]